MSSDKPVVILGAGHNGLTSAAYLARQGRQVVVLERKARVGGIAATEPLIDGFQFNTGFSDLSRIHHNTIKELNLEGHGLSTISPRTALYAAAPGGGAVLHSDGAVSITGGVDLAPPGPGLAEIEEMAALLAEMMQLPAPDFKSRVPARDLLGWAGLGLRARGRGRRELMSFLRALPLSARDFLDERLRDGALKTGLGVFSTRAALLGPFSAGSTLNMLYQFAGGLKPVFAQGGAGALAAALESVIHTHGGEVHTGSGAARIIVKNGEAAAVEKTDGEVIEASAVLSSLDPGRTLLSGLIDPDLLPVRYVRRLRQVRYNGSTATVHFALRRLPDFGVDPDVLDGWITIAKSISDIERAYDDAKHGRHSKKPALILRIPSLLDPSLVDGGGHSLTAEVRYAPFRLRDGSDESIAERVIETILEFAPDFRDAIIEHRTITPAMYAQEYGLTEGAWSHGQMAFDQLLFMRPVPGWANYRTPIRNLWLCGSGSHPGGGITCAPGWLAAREFLAR